MNHSSMQWRTLMCHCSLICTVTHSYVPWCTITYSYVQWRTHICHYSLICTMTHTCVPWCTMTYTCVLWFFILVTFDLCCVWISHCTHTHTHTYKHTHTHNEFSEVRINESSHSSIINWVKSLIRDAFSYPWVWLRHEWLNVVIHESWWVKSLSCEFILLCPVLIRDAFSFVTRPIYECGVVTNLWMLWLIYECQL